MGACRLARGERYELDATIRVECVRERLCECGEAADERLAGVEVREALREAWLGMQIAKAVHRNPLVRDVP